VTADAGLQVEVEQLLIIRINTLITLMFFRRTFAKWFIDCANVTHVFKILILGYCCSSDPYFFPSFFFREIPRHKRSLGEGRQARERQGRGGRLWLTSSGVRCALQARLKC
jgi:hypothetical protein